MWLRNWSSTTMEMVLSCWITKSRPMGHGSMGMPVEIGLRMLEGLRPHARGCITYAQSTTYQKAYFVTPRTYYTGRHRDVQSCIAAHLYYVRSRSKSVFQIAKGQELHKMLVPRLHQWARSDDQHLPVTWIDQAHFICFLPMAFKWLFPWVADVGR